MESVITNKVRSVTLSIMWIYFIFGHFCEVGTFNFIWGGNLCDNELSWLHYELQLMSGQHFLRARSNDQLEMAIVLPSSYYLDRQERKPDFMAYSSVCDRSRAGLVLTVSPEQASRPA